MNQTEYQRLRRQLDEELRTGIELLQAGHRAKVEALDARWGEAPAEEIRPSEPEPAAPPPPEPAAPAAEPQRTRRRDGEVQADVEAALEGLGEEFQKSDLCRALGYEPRRTSLHRALRELQKAGVIEVQTYGRGRRATRYRKVDTGEEG